jgi:hypothetical protein
VDMEAVRFSQWIGCRLSFGKLTRCHQKCPGLEILPGALDLTLGKLGIPETFCFYTWLII